MPHIDCLQVLKSGLPSNDLPSRHIVIVGAGMAGLTAGLLLREAGHRVTILEAQNRLGGRVYTYHGFPGKLYGEFGAMRFPRQHKLAQHLIQKRFQLPTSPFGMVDEDTFIYLNSTALRRSKFTPADCGFQLADSEASLAPAELLRRTMQPLVDLMQYEDGWQRIAQAYDRYSLIDYLRESKLSDRALEMIGPLLNLEGRFHFSLVEWFMHYYEDVFGDLLYLVDGADALPYAFAPHLMDVIRLGAIVHAIDQDDGGVTVHFHDSTGVSHSIAADECIVTMPFVLLRHMEIQGLDPNKWYTLSLIHI